MGVENRGAGRRWATKCARTYPPIFAATGACRRHPVMDAKLDVLRMLAAAACFAMVSGSCLFVRPAGMVPGGRCSECASGRSGAHQRVAMVSGKPGQAVCRAQ